MRRISGLVREDPRPADHIVMRSVIMAVDPEHGLVLQDDGAQVRGKGSRQRLSGIAVGN